MHMKKFFSFVAASAMMLATGSALADTVVIYSWEGGSEAATESGGTVAANGSNTAVSASRITVSAKKADIATNNVTISLEEALAAGDVITITGYRDKDETTDGNGTLLDSPAEKVGNLYIAFGTGTAIDEGSNNVWNNINANAIGGAKEANTNTYTITDQAGSTTIQLARSKASTNVFITKLLITREVTAPSTTVDYTALNAAIAAAQDTISKGYVTSEDIVTTLNAAITTAQTVLEATSQDDVDAAVTALNTAVTAAIEAQAAVVTPLFADGEYLIVNKETGYYLAGGLDWGTHACLSDKPQFFAASLVDGSDSYTLDSHQSNGGDNHYLGTGLYVDAPAANWTFAQTEEGYFTDRKSVV